MLVIELIAETGKVVSHGDILKAIQQIELVGARMRWPPVHCPTPDGRDRFLVAGDERAPGKPSRGEREPDSRSGWDFG